MSYILDALRKSERQRQLGEETRAHSLQDPYIPEAAERNPWVAIAVVAILLNLSIGGWFWWQHQAQSGDAQPPPMAVSASVPTPAPPAAATQPIGRPAAPAPATTSAVARRAPTTTSRAPAPEPQEVVVFETVAQPPPPAAPAAQRFNDLIDINELPTKLRLAMLALNMNVHVYDDSPSQRFVLIDMKRYAEGHALPQGPMIEAITPDGVVLAWHGDRFLLPRN